MIARQALLGCAIYAIVVSASVAPALAYNFTSLGGRLGRPGVDTGTDPGHDFRASWDIPDNGTMTWYLDRNELDVAECDATCFDELKGWVQPMLDNWSQWIRLDFAEAPSLEEAHLRIRFIDYSTLEYFTASAHAEFKSSGQTLEWTLIRLDPDTPHGWTSAEGVAEFASAILHEAGHALGLSDLYGINRGTNFFFGEDFVDHGENKTDLPNLGGRGGRVRLTHPASLADLAVRSTARRPRWTVGSSSGRSG